METIPLLLLFVLPLRARECSAAVAVLLLLTCCYEPCEPGRLRVTTRCRVGQHWSPNPAVFGPGLGHFLCIGALVLLVLLQVCCPACVASR